MVKSRESNNDSWDFAHAPRKHLEVQLLPRSRSLTNGNKFCIQNQGISDLNRRLGGYSINARFSDETLDPSNWILRRLQRICLFLDLLQGIRDYRYGYFLRNGGAGNTAVEQSYNL